MTYMRCRLIATLVLAVALTCAAAAAEVVGKSAGPLDAKNVRTAESSLGDLIADAARASVNAEMAVVQASQIRQLTLPAGDLTREALTDALLYPDEQVVLVEITGAQLQAALERGLSMLPKPNTAFLQVSGVSITLRSEAPEGQRVLGVRVGAAPLVADRKYKAAMPASLAKGALGYFRVFNGLQPKQTGPAIGEALVQYVLSAKTVSPQSGRLRDLARPAGG